MRHNGRNLDPKTFAINNHTHIQIFRGITVYANSNCRHKIMQPEAPTLLHTCWSLQREAPLWGIWRQMTHTNSLVSSETVTEIWRVWVGSGNCVSGPEQYVKTFMPKCLLQSSQPLPSRSAALCWTHDSGSYRPPPGVRQSAKLHYTAAFVVHDKEIESPIEGRGRGESVRALWQNRSARVRACLKAYFIFFWSCPAAALFKPKIPAIKRTNQPFAMSLTIQLSRIPF